MNRPGRAASAVLAALLVAGCGDGAASTPGSASAPPPAPSASASVSAAPPPVPSASADPVPPPVTAADGTRYAACKDGTCEVSVAKSVKIRIRRGTLSLTKFRAGKSVDFKLDLRDGGGGNGTLKGTCGTIVVFFLGGGGRGVFCNASGIPQRPEVQPGEVALQLAGWAPDGAAVVRVVSG
jgi:hypothetical protein